MRKMTEKIWWKLQKEIDKNYKEKIDENYRKKLIYFSLVIILTKFSQHPSDDSLGNSGEKNFSRGFFMFFKQKVMIECF